MVAMGTLLGLVTWESVVLVADRLQAFLKEPDHVEQCAQVKSRVVFKTDFGGPLFCHPNRNAEALAVLSLEEVGWWRIPAALSYP